MHTSNLPRPVTVTLAATFVALLAGWQLLVRVFPAYATDDPRLLGEVVSLALTTYVAWGIFSLESWAWWLGFIFMAVGTVISLGTLSSFEQLTERVPMADPELAARNVTMLGIVCVGGLVSLMTPSCRAAYR